MLFWAVIAAVVLLNRQNLFDWFALRNYHAPTVVMQLATQDTMTAYGRKIFYVNHPKLDDRATFTSVCPNNGGEHTIVLGCYHGDQGGIFLLTVSDPLLNGVEQVTAAHEMLHAAYDRLSSKDRQHVDAMLMDYYNHDLHDQRLLDTIAAYKKSEPNDVVNEMHSVFGTEVANLPVGLEDYYKRYFTSRQQVAAYAAQYQAEFTSRQAVVKQDDAQLANLKSEIDSTQADLKAKLVVIMSEQQTLQSERSSGDIQAYNAGVPGYNRLVDQYNAEVHSLQLLIDQYNALVSARNAIALQEQQLNNELTGATPIQH